jgi:glycerophosphoryl diester phosphodiesterase
MGGVAIELDGHRTLVKWHRLRRRLDDVPFTAVRLAEGVQLGASMEVDLRCHAGSSFACLHDPTLDRETTGTGALREASADALRALRMRAADGTVSEHKVMLLADLVALTPSETLATVQLDCKETRNELTDDIIAAFARQTAPRARRFILSGHHWDAVTALASAIEGLRIGYDPCETPQAQALRTEDDFTRFADFIEMSAPQASMIYLAFPLVLRARELGVDIVGALHCRGKLVDAYTLNPSRLDFQRVLDSLMECKVDQITTDEALAVEAIWNAR